MPRTGGVYAAPAGTKGIPNTTVASVPYNSFVDDLVADANAARPITAGGTGATTATQARTNLGAIGAGDITAAATKAAPVAADGVVITDSQDSGALKRVLMSFFTNATNQTSGTLHTGRLNGPYAGITGVGALNSGSITSGFGSIDVGTDGMSGALTHAIDAGYMHIGSYSIATYGSGVGRLWWNNNDSEFNIQAVGGGATVVAAGFRGSLSGNGANVTNVDAAQMSAISITAGSGLTGGGAFSTSRTITLGTPTGITAFTTNSVTATSHTHAIAVATQAEAQAGTFNNAFMTPQRTAQAIAALTPAPPNVGVVMAGLNFDQVGAYSLCLVTGADDITVGQGISGSRCQPCTVGGVVVGGTAGTGTFKACGRFVANQGTANRISVVQKIS